MLGGADGRLLGGKVPKPLFVHLKLVVSCRPQTDIDNEPEAVAVTIYQRVTAVMPNVSQRLLAALLMRVDLPLNPPPAVRT